MAESMNHWQENARHLDPVGLFCEYIRKLNRLFEKRRNMYGQIAYTDLPPNVKKILRESMDDGNRLKIIPHNSEIEVRRKTCPGSQRVVMLQGPTCSCGFHAEFGIPCRHMCKAATLIGQHPKSLVNKELQVTSLKETYVGSTIPIDVTDLLDDGTVAPMKTKRRGRHKKNRIPSPP